MISRGKFSILIDSNEYHVGNTWTFPGYITHVKSLLKHGCDYTVRGQSGIIGVERKSFPDYVRCIGIGWDSFRKQLSKLQRNRFHCVIIEGELDSPIHHHTKMTQAAVSRQTARIVSYGIPIMFACDPVKAAKLCENFLIESLKRIREDG